jgi:hypothetical protein
MTESDYIQATNLARIRVITAVLRDMMPWGVLTKRMLGDLGRAAWKIEELLAEHVKTEDEGSRREE